MRIFIYSKINLDNVVRKFTLNEGNHQLLRKLMNQSIFTEIPEGFVIQLFGPVENSWCCELFNQDHTIEIQKYGDSAEMAVQACLTRLQKVRHPVTRSRIAHLPTNLSASRLRKIQIGQENSN